jgi:hypothetical protein
MYQKKQATAQQAEAVVDALIKLFDQPLVDRERPRVLVDTWEYGRTVVVWEEGPHGWMTGTSWEVPVTGLPQLVHGERESFIRGYGWQRSGLSVGSREPNVGGGGT